MNQSKKLHFTKNSLLAAIVIGVIAIALLTTLALTAEGSPAPAALAEPDPILREVPTISLSEQSEASLSEGSPSDAALEEDAAAIEEDYEESFDLETSLLQFVCDLVVDFVCFDIDNKNPARIAAAKYFSGYLGQVVFFGNWSNRRSGSFGKLLGLHRLDKDSSLRRLSQLLKHEHGHYEQYRQIGFLKYLLAIAIPSFTHDPEDYYSQPWEVTADLLGGVTTHYHSAGAEEAGLRYLESVKNADLLSLVIGLIS